MRDASGNHFFLLHTGTDEMVQQVKEFAVISDTVDFDAWNTHSGRRKLVPVSCPLTSIHTWEHVCPFTCFS